MAVKAIYNAIASQYATADCFGSITESHNCAIEQLNNTDLGYKPHFKILDLGVGDGAFLNRLNHQMPLADLTGIDVSEEMLKRA